MAMRCLRGRVLLSATADLGCSAGFLTNTQSFQMRLFCSQLGSQTPELFLLIFLKTPQRFALLLPVHQVPLHQDHEENQKSDENQPIITGNLAGLAEQHAATSTHSRAVHHDRVKTYH